MLAPTGIPNDDKSKVTEKTVNSKPKIAMGIRMFLGINKFEFIGLIFNKDKKNPERKNLSGLVKYEILIISSEPELAVEPDLEVLINHFAIELPVVLLALLSQKLYLKC